MRTAEQIRLLYEDRKKQRAPIFDQMSLIQRHANNDIVVPMPPGMDRVERAMVANLVLQGIDAYGQRIGEVMPNLTCPPTRDRIKGSQEKAQIRKKATQAWWKHSGLDRQLYRRGRWFAGYGTAPAQIWPDLGREIPQWKLRNPLGTYPAPTSDPDELCPPDIIHATRMPLAQIKNLWPDRDGYPAPWRQLVQEDHDPARRKVQDGEAFLVLEYSDAEQIACVIVNDSYGPYQQTRQLKHSVIASQAENRIGLCLSVVPGRITLDRLTGQFDGVIGMHEMRSRFMALELDAAIKQVHPDMYLVPHQDGQQATFVSGPHPGSSGLINILDGGDVKYLSPQVGQNTWQTMDRLERSERQAGGISSEMSGESGSNIRTGQRGQQVISAQVDPTLREAHTVIAAALEEENRRATLIAKAYFGDRQLFFDVNWQEKRVSVDYIPNRDFDSVYTQVSYPQAGMDQQNLTIMAGQLLGTELASKRTLREMHPAIKDAEYEGDQITAEGLEAAAMAAFQQGAADGSIPLIDVARVLELVKRNDVDIIEAIVTAQKEAQERQAAQAPAEGVPPGAQGVDPNSPEAQPGLSLPGMGAEAGVAVPEAQPSLQNLASQMNALRNTSRTPQVA